MTERRVGIVGLGHYVPEKVVTNHDLERMVETTDEWIVKHTGIKERRVAAEGEATSDLALRAARKALDHAGVAPEEVDMIILSTVTPDQPFPSTALKVAKALGAEKAVPLDLTQVACAGFVYGLHMAEHFMQSDRYRNILLIAADTLSRVLDYEDRTTCVFFGDAAGAAVLQPVEAPYGLQATHVAGAYSEDVIIHGGGSRKPFSEKTLENKEQFIRMNGRAVWNWATTTMPDSIEKVMAEAGIETDDVDWFLFHQANANIVDACMQKLGAPKEKTYLNIHKYGNVSGATIPVLISEAHEEGLLKPGEQVVFAAIGAGLVWGAAALRWSIPVEQKAGKAVEESEEETLVRRAI